MAEDCKYYQLLNLDVIYGRGLRSLTEDYEDVGGCPRSWLSSCSLAVHQLSPVTKNRGAAEVVVCNQELKLSSIQPWVILENTTSENNRSLLRIKELIIKMQDDMGWGEKSSASSCCDACITIFNNRLYIEHRTSAIGGSRHNYRNLWFNFPDKIETTLPGCRWILQTKLKPASVLWITNWECASTLWTISSKHDSITWMQVWLIREKRCRSSTFTSSLSVFSICTAKIPLTSTTLYLTVAIACAYYVQSAAEFWLYFCCYPILLSL